MSEMKQEQKETRSQKPAPRGKLTIPFFLVLGVLTVAAFIVPLRPTVSYSEKRELANFPEFSVEALLSGDYFDDISLWFSDTFPGREGWISVSRFTKSLHGYSEVAIVEDDFLAGIIGPVETEAPTEEDTTPTVPAQTTSREEDPSEEATEDTAAPEESTETVPEETQWGGVDVGEGAEISMGAVIQIGDTAFNQIGFDEYVSLRYSRTLEKLGNTLAEQGVTLVSAPPPTAVGVMVEREYQAKLKCAPQDEMLAFLHGNMGSNVVTVDTYSALVAHNSEYIYFRTDHHWTALGAYYSYTAVCEALGLQPAPLSTFEEVDNGAFRGSLYQKARYSNKLREDVVYSYIPAGEITMYNVYANSKIEADLLLDMTYRRVYEKYQTFLGGDYALQEIINESLPEGSVCLIVKDSYGNCFAPFLTQNYHTVYVMDYRAYYAMTLRQFVEKYDVDTVIMMPYLMATQSPEGVTVIEKLCR